MNVHNDFNKANHWEKKEIAHRQCGSKQNENEFVEDSLKTMERLCANLLKLRINMRNVSLINEYLNWNCHNTEKQAAT